LATALPQIGSFSVIFATNRNEYIKPGTIVLPKNIIAINLFQACQCPPNRSLSCTDEMPPCRLDSRSRLLQGLGGFSLATWPQNDTVSWPITWGQQNLLTFVNTSATYGWTAVCKPKTLHWGRAPSNHKAHATGNKLINSSAAGTSFL